MFLIDVILFDVSALSYPETWELLTFVEVPLIVGEAFQCRPLCDACKDFTFD